MKNGVINIFKEKGITSFGVVAVLKKTLNEKKIGHTGTLDPDATGVLPVCIGKATKLVSLLEDTDKVYRAEMLLGKTTDTQDVSGNVIAEMTDEQLEAALGISGLERGAALIRLGSLVKNTFEKLTGDVEQIPPMYSALKVGGVKLVDAARKGQVIERRPRMITVYGYENISADPDLRHIRFDVRCSKGTYIRTLCEDAGRLMGVPACLSELVRLEASGLSVSESLTLEEVKKLTVDGRLEEYIIPPDRFLTQYKEIIVGPETEKRVLVGNFLYSEDLDNMNFENKKYRIYNSKKEFLALYGFDEEKQCLRPVKMFV